MNPQTELEKRLSVFAAEYAEINAMKISPERQQRRNAWGRRLDGAFSPAELALMKMCPRTEEERAYQETIL